MFLGYVLKFQHICLVLLLIMINLYYVACSIIKVIHFFFTRTPLFQGVSVSWLPSANLREVRTLGLNRLSGEGFDRLS